MTNDNDADASLAGGGRSLSGCFWSSRNQGPGSMVQGCVEKKLLEGCWVVWTTSSLKVAGSSTVFPVANAWATNMVNASSFAITIEGGARSTLKGCLQVRCRLQAELSATLARTPGLDSAHSAPFAIQSPTKVLAHTAVEA